MTKCMSRITSVSMPCAHEELTRLWIGDAYICNECGEIRTLGSADGRTSLATKCPSCGDPGILVVRSGFVKNFPSLKYWEAVLHKRPGPKNVYHKTRDISDAEFRVLREDRSLKKVRSAHTTLRAIMAIFSTRVV
jgi:hypothetical protein